MKIEDINLIPLKKYHKHLKPGDIFALKLNVRPNEYLFGRVIKRDVVGGFFPGYALIYIYNHFSKDKSNFGEMDKDNLIIHPVIINKLPWSRGYFEFIQGSELLPEDILDQHIFKSLSKKIPTFYNEYSQEVSGKKWKGATWGLSSYNSVAHKLGRALGY